MWVTNKPKLIVLVGLPGSGKSTFRDSIMTTRGGPFDVPGGWVVLSSDDYIEARAQREDKTYSDVFKDAIKDAEDHIRSRFAVAVAVGGNILYDQTNLSRRKRVGILNNIPWNSYETAALCVEVDERLRQQRLLNRPGKIIPRNIDESMRKSFVRPSLDEGFDHVRIVSGSDGPHEEGSKN